jgi:phosphoribosyl 1,2-cyclic phosphodiesterase
MNYYSPMPELKEVPSGQMVSPYFPVSFDSMGSTKTFHHLENPVKIGNSVINFKRMNHPGGSYAYSVAENGKRFIYSTDTELTPDDFLDTKENIAFFRGADLIVIDCQYTLGEAFDKYNWGHSAFSMAVDFVANWKIKHMVMFHHDPSYNDHKLYSILQSARWYLERMNIKNIELTLAYEGLEISI